ncbi:unnamed protein product [Rhodiola kirilowii]
MSAVTTFILRRLRRGRVLPISALYLSNHQLKQTLISPFPDWSLGSNNHSITDALLNPNSFSYSRSFSSQPSSDKDPFREMILNSSENLCDVPQIVEQVANSSAEGDYILPVRALISLLDGYHDLTGLPWWIILCSSTLALRIALLPLLALQFAKLKRIQQLFPQLPPPFPPLFSGKSYIDQLTLFRKKRREIGCPSFLWILAAASVQIPCFLLGMTTIRKMSLDHHPGFDCGGILWFENLTDYSHGAFGCIFPTVIATLHYANVKISFEKASARKITGLLDLLASYYKTYLKILTLPIFVAGFCVPQGSLVYWVTNSSCSVIQQLSLKHPAVRSAMGLPENASRVVTEKFEALQDVPEIKLLNQKEERTVSAHDLTPEDLLKLSVKYLSEHKRERAIPLLRLALQKDPEYVMASIILGQALLQEGLLEDAADYLERTVSKLLINGDPLEPEKVDLLILASQWAGIALVKLNKKAEGIIHLQRLASIDEPDDPKSKAHYYDGLVLLSSALLDNGQREEAAKHLRKAVVYNPAYQELLDQCEKDDDFVSDLANSRRSD